jgi:hypothetical protein
LISWLQFLAGPGVPVEQNKIAEDYSNSPAIYIHRRPSQQEVFLDGTQSIAETNFDVEIYGEDIDAVEALADTLKPQLNGQQGQMGLTMVNGMFVSDHEGNYESKIQLNTDEGLHVSTFALQIFHLPPLTGGGSWPAGQGQPRGFTGIIGG